MPPSTSLGLREVVRPGRIPTTQEPPLSLPVQGKILSKISPMMKDQKTKPNEDNQNEIRHPPKPTRVALRPRPKEEGEQE